MRVEGTWHRLASLVAVGSLVLAGATAFGGVHPAGAAGTASVTTISSNRTDVRYAQPIAFTATVFALLWGLPFLVKGVGLSEGAASTLLMVMTGWVIVSGLVLGHLVARYPYYRSWFVLVIVGAMAFGWAVVLARSTPAPVWMLVVLVCLMATGGRRLTVMVMRRSTAARAAAALAAARSAAASVMRRTLETSSATCSARCST